MAFLCLQGWKHAGFLIIDLYQCSLGAGAEEVKAASFGGGMKFFEELGVNKKATRQHPPRWGGTWGTNIKSKQNPCSGEHTLGWFEEHNRRWGFGKGG